jgi:hypothetical protein
VAAPARSAEWIKASSSRLEIVSKVRGTSTVERSAVVWDFAI